MSTEEAQATQTLKRQLTSTDSTNSARKLGSQLLVRSKTDEWSTCLGKKGTQATSIPASLVESIPSARRDWHKELLFNLFQCCEDEELCELDQQVGGSILSKVGKEGNLGGQHIGLLKDDNCEVHSSVLTLVPEVLRDYHPAHSYHDDSLPRNHCVTIKTPEEWKRSNLESNSISQLKVAVASKFFNAFHVAEDGACLPTPEPTKSGEAEGFVKTSNSSAAATEGGLSEASDEVKFEPLALKYNECSLSAISRWAATREDRKCTKDEQEKNNTMDPTTFHRPTALPPFRRCNSCGKWGHYNIECDHLCEKEILQLAESCRVQKALRGFVEEENHAVPRGKRSTELDDSFPLVNIANIAEEAVAQPVAHHGNVLSNETKLVGEAEEDEYLIKSNGCELCGSGFRGEDLLLCDGCDGLFHRQCLNPPLDSVPEGDWFCNACTDYDSDVSSIIHIEGCGGYVIEQRKQSMAEKEASTKERNVCLGFQESCSAAVSIVRRDLSEEQESEYAGSHVASIDNLRHKVDFPPLAPGELCWAKRGAAPKGKIGRDDWWPAMVVLETEYVKAGDNLAPYVVKFFSVHGAGRVRPSEVLPFFEYYEDLGQNALGDCNRLGYEEFRRALNEAMLEIGCTSLAQVLKEARDIRKFAGENRAKCTVLQTKTCSENRSSALGEVAREATLESTARSRTRPSRWDAAHIDLQDGIEILGRAEVDDVDDQVSQITEIRYEGKERRQDSRGSGEDDDSGQQGDYHLPGHDFPPVDNFVGGVVAWVTKKHLEEDARGVADSPNNETENFPDKSEAQLQLGIVSCVDLARGKALVRSIPDAENIVSQINAARVQASYNDDDDDDESAMSLLSLHSASFGASIWVPMDLISLVGKAPTGRAVNLCKAALATSLQEARSLCLKRRSDEAREREETMIELLSMPTMRENDNSQGGSRRRASVGGRSSRKKRKRTLQTSPGSNLNASVSNAGAVSPANSVNIKANGSIHWDCEEYVAGEKGDGDAIFSAERILDDRRRAVGGMEYLIKWKGYEDATWEPEKNILNQKLLIIYKADSLLSALRNTHEATDYGTKTARVVRALEFGKRKLISSTDVIDRERKGRICPFCLEQFRDGSSFGGHSRSHVSEPNYRLMKEVSRIAERDWFDDEASI